MANAGIIAAVKKIDSRQVYRSPWMTVREDTILREDGSPGRYGVVDKPDFALIIPLDAEGFWLVEQYRYPVERRAWEFPQGSWGRGASGSRLDLAVAELREETGMEAEDVRHLGHLYGAYGFCSQGFDVYLATGLQPGPTAREPSEQDMQHRWVADAELVEMIRDGLIIDAATVAAYGLLLLNRG
jgi:8-oxo-dGTP pyrophosphatase MutT (NUDIX family)